MEVGEVNECKGKVDEAMTKVDDESLEMTRENGGEKKYRTRR